ncbi:VanZ family protein [Candidatus Marithrix sp. Canyon 246]|uniref:VanZ family protein n=1 Tax=Candidatus Marithrix sp. Canyon 246 TaxID=1827136 RepID=UPI00084A1E09|nr:VanZ family protein [Candidatus Marithrix sp. Canyon 246]
MKQTLRYKTLWLSIGMSLIITVIALSLMAPPTDIMDALPNDKFGHFIAYFALMGWFAQIYHTNKQRWLYLIAFLILGLLLEILQGLGGVRHGDWVDMLANSAGVVSAFVLTKTKLAYILLYIENQTCQVLKT